MHPNGKWVWVASANGGKGDWRTANGRAHKKHQETNGKKEGDGEKKTIDDHASGASTDALKRAAADENAKPEVREAAKKELEKRNDGTKQKKNDKASSSTESGKVDISKIPDAEFKRITQMLEKKNPDHRDAERYLEEEAMSDNELKNFYAVAEHFKNSSNINKMTQEYCKKWAELAKQEMQSRNSNSDTNSEQVNAEQNNKSDKQVYDENSKQKLSVDELNNINGVYAQTIKYSPYLNDGKNHDMPYISIMVDTKKDVKRVVKEIKEKLGLDVKEDDFEHHPRNRYSDSYYEVCASPLSGKFASHWNINKIVEQEYLDLEKSGKEDNENSNNNSALDEIRNGKITTKSVEKFLDDDDIKGKAFLYFNYGDEDDCTEEEADAFNKLEKLGAKIGKYFDWNEEGESDTYKMKMQTRGYRLFDISTSGGYLWLMIKNNKLKGDDIKKGEEEYLSVSTIM